MSARSDHAREPTPEEAREARVVLLMLRAEEVAAVIGGGTLGQSIADAASRYWDYDGADVSDFGHVLLEGETLWFGRRDCVSWSPASGFSPAAECSPGFAARARELGPLPGTNDAVVKARARSRR